MMVSIRSVPYRSLSLAVILIVVVEVIAFNTASNVRAVGADPTTNTFLIFGLIHILLIGACAAVIGRLMNANWPMVSGVFGIGLAVSLVAITALSLLIPLASTLEWKEEWRLFFDDLFSRLLLSI